MAIQSPVESRPSQSAPVAPTPRPMDPEPPASGRHLPRRAVIPLALIVVALIAWLVSTQLMPLRATGGLSASGTVEADEVVLSSEVVGRIVAISVVEGQVVNQGDQIARLDDSAIQLQYRQGDTATRQQLELQADKYVIRAPVAGTITRIPAHVGEVTSPGQAITTVSDLSNLKLTVYVLEGDLGQVQLRQPVTITADPFPGQGFDGVVTALNQRAEFTPRNIQTQRDRLNLVFGVKVAVQNPNGALKPGMPVDATFGPVS